MAASLFVPLQTTDALLDQVHDRLVAAIADGTLSPGQRLTQEEVAAQLGVSRQPVSHALQVLRRRGLVIEAGKRGVVVAPLDARRLRDLYQVREALEALAASLAASRCLTPCEIKEGEALLEHGTALAENGSTGALIAADVDFHSFLHRLSGNGAIVETIAEEWPHFRRAMGVVLVDKPTRRRVWAEHAEILAHVYAGDAVAAAAAARRHFARAGEEAASRLEATTE
jgi:DNA-binding GntR family transcriptional regulator